MYTSIFPSMCFHEDRFSATLRGPRPNSERQKPSAPRYALCFLAVLSPFSLTEQSYMKDKCRFTQTVLFCVLFEELRTAGHANNPPLPPPRPGRFLVPKKLLRERNPSGFNIRVSAAFLSRAEETTFDLLILGNVTGFSRFPKTFHTFLPPNTLALSCTHQTHAYV